MPRPNRRLSLLDLALAAGDSGRRTISDPLHRLTLSELEHSTSVSVPLEALRGRSVLVRTGAQLPTVLALLALDGVARRLILALPDLKEAHLPQVITDSATDFVLGDDALSPTLRSDLSAPPVRDVDTQWILFTSGSTRAPKMVSHTL